MTLCEYEGGFPHKRLVGLVSATDHTVPLSGQWRSILIVLSYVISDT